MENGRIVALLESMIETTEGIQANLEKMKIHCNRIQSILSSRSSISFEPKEGIQDLGENMQSENHHWDKMQFSNCRTPRSAEIDETLEEVTGIQVSVVLPSPGDNRNNLIQAKWMSSELKMDSPWIEVADSYCLPAYLFDEEGTIWTHQAFDEIPKGRIYKCYKVTMCFDPGIQLCPLTGRCPCNVYVILTNSWVNLPGWPPPARVICSKFGFPLQIFVLTIGHFIIHGVATRTLGRTLFNNDVSLNNIVVASYKVLGYEISVVRHCSSSIAAIKLGRLVVLGELDTTGFSSWVFLCDNVEYHFLWNQSVSSILSLVVDVNVHTVHSLNLELDPKLVVTVTEVSNVGDTVDPAQLVEKRFHLIHEVHVHHLTQERSIHQISLVLVGSVLGVRDFLKVIPVATSALQVGT